jgi:hypothetical protein
MQEPLGIFSCYLFRQWNCMHQGPIREQRHTQAGINEESLTEKGVGRFRETKKDDKHTRAGKGRELWIPQSRASKRKERGR